MSIPVPWQVGERHENLTADSPVGGLYLGDRRPWTSGGSQAQRFIVGPVLVATRGRQTKGN